MNKNPVQSDRFVASQFQRIEGEPLSSKVLGVKPYLADEQKLMELHPDPKERAAWLRKVIHEALQRCDRC